MFNAHSNISGTVFLGVFYELKIPRGFQNEKNVNYTMKTKILWQKERCDITRQIFENQCHKKRHQSIHDPSLMIKLSI